MAGAELSPRERLLTTASRLFYREGIGAVGINRVVAESGVARATLYAHFSSKDDLVVAHLARVDGHWRAQLEASAAAGGPEPGEQLVALFDAVLTACARPGFSGCGFLNAAAESLSGGPVREAVIEHKRTVRAWVRGLAERAGANDPEALAVGLTVLLDGALADAALEGETTPAHRAKDAARLLVAAATAPVPHSFPPDRAPVAHSARQPVGARFDEETP